VTVALAALATFSSRARGSLAFGAVWVALVLAELVAPQRAVDRGIPRDVLEMDTPILREAREVASETRRVSFPTEHWSLLFPRTSDMPDEWWPRVRLDREQGHFYHPVGERIPTVLVNPDRLVTGGAAERGRVAGLLSRDQRASLLRLLAVGAEVRVGHAALDQGAPLYATIAGWPVTLVRNPDAPRIVRWLRTVASPTDAKPWSAPFLHAWVDHLARNQRPEALEVERSELGHWVVRTSADEGGWVALTETSDPGWSAFVDGSRADIVPYLDTFMAVPVDAGRHRVEFRYRPRRFAALLAISSLGLVAIRFLAVRS
jgi:hypothetical protein